MEAMQQERALKPGCVGRPWPGCGDAEEAIRGVAGRTMNPGIPP